MFNPGMSKIPKCRVMPCLGNDFSTVLNRACLVCVNSSKALYRRRVHWRGILQGNRRFKAPFHFFLNESFELTLFWHLPSGDVFFADEFWILVFFTNDFLNFNDRYRRVVACTGQPNKRKSFKYIFCVQSHNSRRNVPVKGTMQNDMDSKSQPNLAVTRGVCIFSNKWLAGPLRAILEF